MAYIELKNPNEQWHGKRKKRDHYYFRFHYGKQRIVCLYKEYIDKPTERQKASRKDFTTLRREVARQLHDPILRMRWEKRFQNDKEGYKMLHTYVYAQMKAGISVMQSPTCRDAIHCLSKNASQYPQKCYTAARDMQPFIVLCNGTITPIFLPWKVPKRECLRI